MLDLLRHTPAEFEGKTLTLEGREYTIGTRVRDGDQGYAHLLYNRRSGLCLHVIQIRREYQSAPTQALQASLEKELGTAKLRDGLRANGKPNEVSPLSVRRGHGGSFELHEIPWGMWAQDGAQTARAEIAGADGCEDHAAAVQMLGNVLRRYPDHSVALQSLAHRHAARDEHAPAFEAIARAVEVEPNLARYRGMQLAIHVHSVYQQPAPKLYDELQRLFPHYGDDDHYGVFASLFTGNPARAQAIFAKGRIAPAQAGKLGTLVENSLAARRRYEALDRRLAQSKYREPALPERLHELRELQALAGVDPDIKAALGFTLNLSGDYRAAVPMLGDATSGIAPAWKAHCWANAAYCTLRSGDWRTGMTFLNVALDLHERAFGGFRLDMLPGLVEWIALDGGVLEKSEPSAAELIGRALHACPDKSLITPAMHRLDSQLRNH